MFSDLAYRIRAMVNRGRMESELAEELEFHFEHQVEVLLDRGYPLDEARRRARLIFGGLDQVKEDCRDARGVVLLEELWQDIRYAVRLLAKAPGLTAIAVVSLAVGVGSSTLASWLVGQAAFRSLPVKAPEQLVVFRDPSTRSGSCAGTGVSDSTCFSYPVYRGLRGLTSVFSGVFARTSLPADLTFRRRTERVSVELVSLNYFEVLGVEPAAGRLFSTGNGAREQPPVAVLSHEYWMRRFAGDPAVVGQSVVLNKLAVTIAGVSAKGLHSVAPNCPPDVVVPIEMEEILLPAYPMLSARDWSWINIVGRLKPGIARQSAQAELGPAYERLVRQEAGIKPAAPGRLELIPAGRGIEPEVDGMLASLSAIAVCVLLIACANLAGLCLARAAARQKEIAIRAALGASRARVARQLLAEFLLPAVTGGVLGLLLALGAAGVVPRILFDEQRARTLTSGPDAGALLLAFAASAAIADLFGAVPALWPAVCLPRRVLDTGNIAPLGLRPASFRRLLVTAQVALSAGLMFGAFSFSRNLLRESMWRRGLARENALEFLMDASAKGYFAPQAARLFERVELKLSTMPGVRGAGFLAGGMSRFEMEGRALKSPGEDRALWLQVSASFFDAAGCSLVEGRGFGLARAWPRAAAVVNEAFQRRLFAGGSALGQHVKLYGDNRWAEVVGVVRDEESAGFFSRVPAVYFPYAGSTAVSYYVRTDRPPELLLSAVKGLVEKEAPEVPPYELQTVAAHYAGSSRSQRVMAAVLGVLGLLTMALTCVGVYGVTAYAVTRRRHEIAIRMALGAAAGTVVSMVMKEVFATIASGIAACLLLVPMACGRLFPAGGPVWRDEYPVFAAGAIVVAVAAALAGFRAARGAARIGPGIALSGE